MMRAVLLRMSRSRSLERWIKRRKFARKAVRRFMPGEGVDDALEAADALRSLPTAWGVRPLTETAANTLVEGHESRRMRSQRLLPRRGAWRRAVVLAEVLGPPLTARSTGSYPGPPAGWS